MLTAAGSGCASSRSHFRRQPAVLRRGVAKGLVVPAPQRLHGARQHVPTVGARQAQSLLGVPLKSCLVASRLTPFRCTPPHLMSPRLASPRIASPRLVLSRLDSPRPALSRPISSSRVSSCSLLISLALSRLVLAPLVPSGQGLAWLRLAWHVMSLLLSSCLHGVLGVVEHMLFRLLASARGQLRGAGEGEEPRSP